MYSSGNTKPALCLPILTTMEDPDNNPPRPPLPSSTIAILTNTNTFTRAKPRKRDISLPQRPPRLHHQRRNPLLCPGNRHSRVPDNLSAWVGKDMGIVDNPRALREGVFGVYRGLDF